VSSLRTRLEQTPEISFCVYLNHQQSYEQGVKILKAKGESAAIAALTPATTPTVFVCQVKRSGDAATVKTLFDKLSGVDSVTVGAWGS
jgi:cell division protein FtsX